MCDSDRMAEVRTMEIRLYPNKSQERTSTRPSAIAASYTTISWKDAGTPMPKGSGSLPHSI